MQSLNRGEIQLARRDGRYSQPCVRGRGHLYRPTSTLTPYTATDTTHLKYVHFTICIILYLLSTDNFN